ncbi:MAG: GTP 3',8-cyclase MoaA [Sulfolobales archaeon]
MKRVDRMIIDRFGRPLESLRITVTHKCNFSCFFCHMEGESLESSVELSYEDIGIVVEAFSRLGVRRYKITGGEPTLRRDILHIVREVKTRGRAEDLSMTTNGFRLEELAFRLREEGLSRINISIHSLKRDTFRMITGVDGLERVLKGLEAAKKAGFKQIKINTVLLRGVNEGEILDLIELVRGDDRMVLQIIELHPVGMGAGVFNKHFLSMDYVEKLLSENISHLRIRRDLHNRPVYYLREGGAIELVRPVSNPIFCAGCNRLRLTADGFLKPCLLKNRDNVDLKPVLFDESLSREEKINKIIELIYLANQFREPSAFWALNRDLDFVAERFKISGDLRDRIRIHIPKRYYSYNDSSY